METASPTHHAERDQAFSRDNVDALKRLLQVEKRLAEVNSHAKTLRKDKSALQRTVLEFMKENRVGDIALRDGYSLIRKETQRKEPLKFADLEKGLARKFRISQEEMHEIIATIKSSTHVSTRVVLQLKKPPKKKSKPTN